MSINYEEKYADRKFLHEQHSIKWFSIKPGYQWKPPPDWDDEEPPSKVPNAAGGVGTATLCSHSLKGPPENNAWDIYNTEASKVDFELIKDWTASLNSLLVFAAIFSAVLSAFVVESKKLLEQDPSDSMKDAMVFYINQRVNGTLIPYVNPDFQPSTVAISINCLLFGSLGASLVAAFASIVALQWVTDY
ncbi:hypothetical protein M408DRAFT_307663, partial [Serendipita vermifera MAFF 305830]